MKKNFKRLAAVVLLLAGFQYHAQTGSVGINTDQPNKATVLDIKSNQRGILIPRLTDAERDQNLSDNDVATVPPAGVVNTSLIPGTLIFNTTTNGFQYWDGVLWRQFFVSSSSTGGNDGVVKINSGTPTATNTTGKPVVSLDASGSGYSPRKQIVYNVPLIFAAPPTTSWPESATVLSDMTPNIYTTTGNKFRENNVQGQVHVWRLICTVEPGSNSAGSVKATILNPDSSFEINSIQLLPKGSQGAGNILTFYFYTIADSASLDAGKGYQLFVEADIDCTVRVDSFTRVSLFKD